MAKVIGLFATDSELVVPSVMALTDLLNNGDIMEEVQPAATDKKKSDKKYVTPKFLEIMNLFAFFLLCFFDTFLFLLCGWCYSSLMYLKEINLQRINHKWCLQRTLRVPPCALLP